MSAAFVWTVILGLGLVTALIRYSFLGLFHRVAIPPRLRTVLSFVPVSVLPAVAAPMVFAADHSAALPVAAKVAAALFTLVIGIGTRSMMGALLAGVAATPVVMWLAA